MIEKTLFLLLISYNFSDSSVGMIKCSLQSEYIQCFFRSAIEKAILVTSRYFASAGIGCDGFAPMNHFTLTKSLLVRVSSR